MWTKTRDWVFVSWEMRDLDLQAPSRVSNCITGRTEEAPTKGTCNTTGWRFLFCIGRSMRYSIFDFNQELCVQLNLTMNDLLLLDYIQKAAANPKMKHHTINGLCVWLNHEKIMEDLPILNISESTLKRRLSHLVDLGLLSREITFSKSHGRRAYYGITETLVDLQISRLTDKPRDEASRLTDKTYKQISRLISEPSYKELVNNNKKIKTNSINTISRKSLVKKKSLFEDCMDMITLYTKDKPEIQNLLIQYLKLRLEMKDKPLYKNQWKGILNKLDVIHKDTGDSYEDIIQFNIEKGYASFFPIPKYRNKPAKKKRACDEGVSCDKWTDEELKEIEKWQKEQIAKGERITF